jgi:hypothetical protein
MEENSPCKKITFLQPEGSWKKGRPKLRWLNSVLKNVELLKVETWWKKALDMISGRKSSRRPRSIKDCRARERRRSRPHHETGLSGINYRHFLHYTCNDYSTMTQLSGIT